MHAALLGQLLGLLGETFGVVVGAGPGFLVTCWGLWRALLQPPLLQHACEVGDVLGGKLPVFFCWVSFFL